MKRMFFIGKIAKKSAAIFLGALLLLSTAACGALDVVAKESAESFEAVLSALDDKAAADEPTGGWKLSAPDESAAFIWSSARGQNDVMLIYDIKPFTDAGLDIKKLPDSYTAYDNKLVVGAKLGSDTLKYNGEPTPIESYKHIINSYPDILGYHTAMDHFGVTVADGVMFEWAKDMSKNDKDIVFVLNPEPLIEAGVDPEAVEGWIYAKVPMGMNGKSNEVYKLLKPFNLQ